MGFSRSASGIPPESTTCRCKDLTVAALSQEKGFIIADDLAALKQSAEREGGPPCRFCRLCWAAITEKYPTHHERWVANAIAARSIANKYRDLTRISGWEFPITVSGTFNFSIDERPPPPPPSSSSSSNSRDEATPPLRLKPEKVRSIIEIGTERMIIRRPTLGVFALPDSKGATYVHERSSTRDVDTSQKACLDLITTWMHECNAIHANCCMSTTGQDDLMPTRIMDVGSAASDSNPRLITTNGRHPGKYLALSYCWGPPGPDNLKLTSSNMRLLTEGLVDETMFAKTHREAFHLTRLMGIRYIWIDALCIIQGDPDDWSKESRRMGDIYRGAYLTIVAGSSTDVRSGFLQSRANKVDPCPIPLLNPGHQEPFLFATLFPSIDEGPTSTRGWCYQEATLSRRSLIFGVEQMIFRCPAGTALELDHHSKVATPIFSPEVQLLGKDAEERRHAMLQHWYMILRDFTTRQLTNPGDVFASTSSLAQLAARHLASPGHRYLAGLWEADMIRGLLWRARYEKSQPAVLRRPRPVEGISVNRAPSWSWASVHGAIDHIDFRPHENFKDVRTQNWIPDGNWIKNSVFSVRPSFVRASPAVEVEGTPNRSWSQDTSCRPDAIHMPACELQIMGSLTRGIVSDRRVNIRKWEPRYDWRPPSQRGVTKQYDGFRPCFESALSIYAHGSYVLGEQDGRDKSFAVGVFDVEEEACKEVWCLQLTEVEGLMLRLVRNWDDIEKFQRVGLFWLEDRHWFNGIGKTNIRLV